MAVVRKFATEPAERKLRRDWGLGVHPIGPMDWGLGVHPVGPIGGGLGVVSIVILATRWLDSLALTLVQTVAVDVAVRELLDGMAEESDAGGDT